jgi:ferredoxin-fold anticodon binding domain-containing protein
MMKNPLPDVRSLTSESGKGNERLKVMNVSVFRRSHIRNFFEKSGKVRVVSISDIISYRIDRRSVVVNRFLAISIRLLIM